jgi:hypothetical protein
MTDRVRRQLRQVGNMKYVNTDQLKRVIESQHGGTATFVQSVRVHPSGSNKVDWDGVVHLFDLKDHPKARRAYAWSSPIQGSTKPRFFAVLHMGPVTGPMEAVRAAATAIRKWGAQSARK